MTSLISIDKTNYPEIFEENVDKYLFVDENKNIIGISIINDNLEYNKIKINILEDYRSSGNGKDLFQKTVNEYKNKYNQEKLYFKVDNQNLINNILHKAGAVSIGNKEGIVKFVLPL